MKSATTHVYALIDPRTNRPFYVGKTDRLERRIREHVNCARQGLRQPLYARIREILDANQQPVYKILETYEDREVYWINELSKEFQLVNLFGTGPGAVQRYMAVGGLS